MPMNVCYLLTEFNSCSLSSMNFHEFPLTAHEVPLTSFFLATHLMVCLGKLENLRLHSGTAEAFHDLLGGAPSGVPGVRKNLSEHY